MLVFCYFLFSSLAGLPKKQDQMQTTNIPSSAPARQRSYGAGEVQGNHNFPDQQEKLQAGHIPRNLVFFSNLQKPSLEGKEDWPLLLRAMQIWKQDVKSSPFLLNKDIFRIQSHSFPSPLCVYPACRMVRHIFISLYFIPSSWPVTQVGD